MEIVIFMLLWLGVALLAYCVMPRTRRWDHATSCRCGYEVESLTGNDPEGPGLRGTKACPECGALLTLQQVRVRGQIEQRYAPKQLAFFVVGVTWCVIAFASIVLIVMIAPPKHRVHNTWVTAHRVAKNEVTITWSTRDDIYVGVADSNSGTTVSVDIDGARSFTIELAETEYTRKSGWQRWLLRDDEGNEQWVAQADMPDAMTRWLQRSTGLATAAENATLFVVLREGAFGVARAGEPMVYQAAKPTRHLMQRVQREYPPMAYAFGAIAGLFWLFGVVRSMQVIHRRQTYVLAYA